jgi:hypothetical protein
LRQIKKYRKYGFYSLCFYWTFEIFCRRR